MKRIGVRIDRAQDGSVCIGCGFVALDIVEGERGHFAAAGGSCGNVMTILSWLGWSSQPIARLGNDEAGNRIVEELDSEGVDVSRLTRETTITTPIVVQRFVTSKEGSRVHRFSISCPECGAWLPRYRPTTIRQIEGVVSAADGPGTFYFDRVTPAALRVSKWAKLRGSLIVFEPSSIGDEGMFRRAVEDCDVLKYSKERLGHIPDLAATGQPKLIVETAGAEGLALRWKGKWSHLSAFEVEKVQDAAGSGDWCTAALIHKLGSVGRLGLSRVRRAAVEDALRLGQGLAALNCMFEGARGLMSNKDIASTNVGLRVLQERANVPDEWTIHREKYSTIPERLCELCKPRERESRLGHAKRASGTV